MSEFVCMTRLDFKDTIEGQVLHVGTEKSCHEVARAIKAVTVSDGRVPIDASVIVHENTLSIHSGQSYYIHKDCPDIIHIPAEATDERD